MKGLQEQIHEQLTHQKWSYIQLLLLLQVQTEARSVQFQQQLQEKDDEINRLRRELRVRIQKLVLSAQIHLYYMHCW